VTSPVLCWLDGAPEDRGIRFADATGGWTMVSYRRLAERTRRTAASLRRAGLVPGDRLAVVARTGPAFVTTFFGALAAGCVPAPLATPAAFQSAGSYAEHLTGALRAAEVAAVAADPDLVPELVPLASAAPVLDAAALAHGADPGITGSAPDPDSVALVQFTSGASGTARGVLVPHRALAANVEAIRGWLGMTEVDATASWLPLHHDMGLVGCLLAPVVNRSDLWLMRPEQFLRRPLDFLDCLGANAVRFTAMPAFGLAYLLRRIPAAGLGGLDLSGLRALIVGAERLDPAVLARFDALLAPHGLRSTALRPAYGLAESTLTVTGSLGTAPWRRVRRSARRGRSVYPGRWRHGAARRHGRGDRRPRAQRRDRLRHLAVCGEHPAHG
jgi:acyl-CoA synthetase (AMP-forming)/AMP-acid ligase II